MEPQLTITTRRGIGSVTVHFDEGEERAAFDLLRDALPAVEDLDRRVRRSHQSRATDTKASGPQAA